MAELSGAVSAGARADDGPATYPKVTAIFGKDLAAAFNDREIRVTGCLTKYRDGIEVILEDLSKLTIVDLASK